MTGFHQELKLVRGILNAPGDTNSAEQGYFIIDLLSGAAQGLALSSELDGWNPSLPAPKAGLWTDIPFADGRTPIAAAEANVTETMRLTATAPTHVDMSQLISELNTLADDCNRYWNDEFYNQPVFLHWFATGAPGPQYALIMSVDVDVSIPTVDDNGNILRDVTLTIEREPYWRAEVPPGANPIYWTLYADSKLPGLNYDYLADLRLSANLTFPLLYALAQDTLSNFVNYTALSYSTNTVNNWNGLTVPAADIPGDAPALVQIALTENSPNAGADPRNFTYMLARSTRTPQLDTMRDGGIARFVTMIPFTAGLYFGASVLAADTGGIGGFNITTSTTITASRVEITPAVAIAGFWSANTAIDRNMERGRFAVFVRARQHNGAAGDLTMRVRFGYGITGLSFSVLTNTVSPTLQTGAGNTTNWPLTYMGTVRLPPDRDAVLSLYGVQGGSGLYNDGVDSVVVTLEVARSTGTGVLYFEDVILLPYDEVLIDGVQVDPIASGQVNVIDTLVLDNTGYLSRGKPVQVAVAQNLFGSGSPTDVYQPAIEARGVPLTLLPGVDNTIFILQKTDATLSRMKSDTIKASLNIVPRWRGIREV
jgi:hypothetical protein